jgi:hypothetical protein
MDIKDLYELLLNKASEGPCNYTATVMKKILQISEDHENHADTILALIFYHEMIKIKKIHPDISPLELENKMIRLNTKKSAVHTVVYSGKTYEGGKGVKFTNIDDQTRFPSELKSIIVAYIDMIT